MSRIMEETGAVLYVKGQHVEPALKHRTQLAPGVKFLHVEIIAPTPIQVQRARCVSRIHTDSGGPPAILRCREAGRSRMPTETAKQKAFFLFQHESSSG